MRGFLAGVFFFFVVFMATSSFGPVVFWMNAHDIARSGDVVEARVIGWKVRNCVVVPGTAIGWARVGGQWGEVPFEFSDDPSPGSSYPLGRHSFGLWRWSAVPDAATRLRLTLNHNCNGRVRVTTALVMDLPAP